MVLGAGAHLEPRVHRGRQRETSAGGTVINDYLLGYANPNVPFGGVNNSGIGKSHGWYGFEAFSTSS